jgi:hypothetical protein
VILRSQNNIVLIGGPGAGKTTTIKYICQQLLTDENFLGPEITFPFLIRLREDEVLRNKEIPIFGYILNTLGITVDSSKSGNVPLSAEQKMEIDAFKKHLVLKILDEKNPFLLFDGFDEVPDEYIKMRILKNLEEISLAATKTRFLITTRKGDDLFHIDNVQRFELSPLKDHEMLLLASRWLKETKAEDFIQQLKASSVYDAGTRPLNLSHLCVIYEDEGRIPEKSRSIYRKIVYLLIEGWNNQNQVFRQSRFKNFPADRKKEFLEHLAYELSARYRKNQFSTSDLENCYLIMYKKYGLPYNQMRSAINEIQVHNGLVTQIDHDTFEFAHKSFQEYLAAEYLVRLPRLPEDLPFFALPSEMALAVTLSSDPSAYLSFLIDDHLLDGPLDMGFLQSFFERIFLEKPEFMESIELGASLLRLQSLICERMLTIPSYIQRNGHTLSTHNIPALDRAFKWLLEFDNIRSSLPLFIDESGMAGTIHPKGKFVELRLNLTTYRTRLKSFYLMTPLFHSYLIGRGEA